MVLLPSTVSRKLPVETPVPFSGTVAVRLELVTVRTPLRIPMVGGVNVMVTEQLAPGGRVVVLQGTVTA